MDVQQGRDLRLVAEQQVSGVRAAFEGDIGGRYDDAGPVVAAHDVQSYDDVAFQGGPLDFFASGPLARK
jgi:hypothetical protein